MSPDVFEDELRTLLHGATDAQSPAFTDVDTDAVLTTGHRIVRRRRLAMVGGTAAAALVVAAGTWAAVGGSADRAAPIPATRNTAPATGPVTAVLEQFAELSGLDGEPAAIGGPRRVGATLVPGLDPRVEFFGVDGTTRTPLSTADLTGRGPLTVTWRPLDTDGHVLGGVLPADAVEQQLITPVDEAGGHAATTVEGALPGTGRKVFATRFEVEGDARTVEHVVWLGRDGVVRDENGSVVPSVRLEGSAFDATVWVSREMDRLGTFGDDGGSNVTLDASRNSSGRPILSMGRGDGGGKTVTGQFIAVVPADAVPGVITPRDGTVVTQPLTKVTLPGTDSAVLWATWTEPMATDGAGYSSVTWTENGRTVTQTR